MIELYLYSCLIWFIIIIATAITFGEQFYRIKKYMPEKKTALPKAFMSIFLICLIPFARMLATIYIVIIAFSSDETLEKMFDKKDENE